MFVTIRYSDTAVNGNRLRIIRRAMYWTQGYPERDIFRRGFPFLEVLITRAQHIARPMLYQGCGMEVQRVVSA